MQFSFIKDNPRFQFVPIKSGEVEQVEDELGIVFPKELMFF
ncbi:hypothetical protein [Lysinibacillus sp. fls2-241-R2A-57]|nr:hypothetical protein [Lysinibacillus sp. fls2-241-R2A-57]